jgi:hypothetical protein
VILGGLDILDGAGGKIVAGPGPVDFPAVSVFGPDVIVDLLKVSHHDSVLAYGPCIEKS